MMFYIIRSFVLDVIQLFEEENDCFEIMNFKLSLVYNIMKLKKIYKKNRRNKLNT